ncbi:MAG: FkbM family methyltransferase [Pseudomonadota bacterium]
MRRLIREWQTLGGAGFAAARKRKAANKIKARYHQLVRTPVIPSRYGVNMVANWPDTTFRFCIDAAYGFELHDLLMVQQAPFIFLDIGANQGLYSLIAGKNKACMAGVAFEPMPQTFELLQSNLAANRFDNITAVNAAISDNTGTATLSINPKHTGGASLHQSGNKNTTQLNIETIDHQRVNELVPPTHPIVAKVDVEGHEQTVFEQLAQCDFADRLSLIHYEVDEKWLDPKALQNTLENIGFRHFQRIDSQRTHHYDIVASREQVAG